MQRNYLKEVTFEDECEFVDETETGEEAHVDSNGTDHDYTQQDDPTDEDEGDNGLDASAHKPQANMGKLPKRNRSDTMFLAGMRGLEKKNRNRTCMETNSDPNEFGLI